MTKSVKVTLDDSLENYFETIKAEESLTVDAELFRKLLIEEAKRRGLVVEEVLAE